MTRQRVYFSIALVILIAISIFATFSNSFNLNEGGVIPDNKYRYVIGVSQYKLDDSWNFELMNTIRGYSENFQNINILFTDAGGNDVRQKNDIEKLANLGCDAILVAPGNLPYLTEIISMKYLQGIPIGIIGAKPLNNSYAFSIYCDRYDLGYTAGRYLGSVLKDGAIILEIRDQSDYQKIDDATIGFRKGIDVGKGITIEYVVIGYGLKEKTEERVEEILQKSPSVDAIFAFSDLMGLSAYNIASKMYQQPLIVGIGGQIEKDEGLMLVKEKKLNSIILNPSGGKEAIDIALRVLSSNESQIDIELEPVVINYHNVDYY